MIEDVRELLPLYALGILAPEEAAAVERALALEEEAAARQLALGSVAKDLDDPNPRLAVELATYQRAAESFVTPVLPSPAVKARLLASVGAGRFEPFAVAIGTLFDVALDRARELLGLIERPASWAPLAPGIAMVRFAGGPTLARAECGFLRIAPGSMFPFHRHVGEEAALVLAGRVHDVTGDRKLAPGDSWTLPGGTSHVLVCDSTEDCICAVRAIDGIVVGGVAVWPTRA